MFRAVVVIAALYAWWRGGAPERIASGMFLSATLATIALRSPWATRYAQVEGGVLLVDLLLLAGLAWLSLRADRRWPIWCTALHVLATAGHMVKAVNPDLVRPAYQLMLIISSWPTLALVLIGTRRHQNRLRRNGVDPSWSISSRPSRTGPESLRD